MTARNILEPSRFVNDARIGELEGDVPSALTRDELERIAACVAIDQVAKGKAGPGGVGLRTRSFCRFLAATSAHRYAPKSNLFPACAPSNNHFLLRWFSTRRNRRKKTDRALTTFAEGCVNVHAQTAAARIRGTFTCLERGGTWGCSQRSHSR